VDLNKDQNSNNPNGSERRAYERYPVQLGAKVNTHGAVARTCTIRDFCIGGMQFAYDSAANESNVSHLCTPVTDDTVSIECSVTTDEVVNNLSFQGQVVRHQGSGFAIRFINPDLMALQVLQTYAKSLQSKSAAALVESNANDFSDKTFNGKVAKEIVQGCDQLVRDAAKAIITKFHTEAADHLFEISKESRDLSEQNACFDALKVLNNKKDSVTDSFLESVIAQIDNYQPDESQSAKIEEKPLSASLSIVEDEVFDDWLADSSTIDSVETKYKDVLIEIERRLSVVCNAEIKKENNPYGPVLFSHIFHDVLKPLDLRHSMNLVCYKVFKNVLLESLGNLYGEINKYLRDNDVLREISFKAVKPVVDASSESEVSVERAEKVVSNEVPVDKKIEVSSENQQDLYKLFGDLKTLQQQLSGQIGKEAVDNFVQGSLQSGTDGSQVGGEQAVAPVQYSQNEVLNALSLIKSAPTVATNKNEARDYKAEILKVLGKRTSDGGKEIGVRENQIMDVASNIFHSMAGDLQVSDKVRGWIDQLELPVLKIAMTDESLFTDKSHAVREVINKVAQLEVLAGSAGQSAVGNAIKWIIDLVNQEFDGSTEVFVRAVKQLDVLLNVQDKSYAQNLKKLINEAESEDGEYEKAVAAGNQDLEADIEWENVDAEEKERLVKQVHRLNEGDWIVFDLDKEKPKRLRIAWIAPRTQRVVFANVMGGKDRMLQSIELAKEMHEGTAKVLDDADEMVMDRAQSSMLQDLHQKLLHQSTHDQLTGLISRREFENRLAETLVEARENKSRHVVCFFDVDQFSVVNSACGYEGGDKLLKEVSEMICERIDGEGVLARLGGDEFGLLLKDCVLDDAMEFAEDQLDSIHEYRLQWEENRLSVGLSIGLVPLSDRSESVSSLLQAAESSCGLAKEMGGNRIQVYNASNAGLSRRRNAMKLAPEIDRIIDEESLYLRCQRIKPICDDASVKDHYEILLGVLDSNGEDISTPEFIEVAERFKRMPDVDRWVVKTAFNWIADNSEALSDEIDMFSINLSGRSLNDDSFMDYILTQIEETGVPVDRVCFEVTETAGVDNLSDASEFIKEIKETGCKFSLDDFGTGGTGMSSYAYLKNLPVDYLKIDGAFVKDMVNNPSDFAVVKSICEIGHFMGKKVIAEFVENDEIWNMLKELGVDYGQGYGIERPRMLKDLG
jgi:diguanylate cyclase (GGDEF)-like protein